MGIVDRARNICLTPTTEWSVIAGETATAGALISGYVVPLAAIGAVAGFIGRSIVGVSLPFIGGTYRVGAVAGIAGAIFGFVAAIIGVFILSLIIDALAPSFGGEKNSVQAMKVAVYSYTPAWIAAVFQIIPALSVLAILGALYGLYLLYLGLPRLMKSPADKALGYTVVVVICAIVITVCVGFVGAAITGLGMIGTGALSGGLSGGTASSSEVRFDKNSTLGKLQDLGNKLEESNKKIAAAEKSGDQSAQVGAALEGLGTLLGGGKHVDPIAVDQLKPFVPDTFAGLTRKSSNVEKTGLAGLMVSKAEARYSDGADKNVTLEITDSGGASGLLGLAGWATLQGEREDDTGVERTAKVDGRLVHEKRSKGNGSNEFGVVLGDRFIVAAKGSGVDFDALKAAVSGLDLAKLESMKDAGVQK